MLYTCHIFLYFQARKEALSSQRKHMMDQLFEKWDNDGSGYLDMEDIEAIMVKYKDGQENEAITKGMYWHWIFSNTYTTVFRVKGLNNQTQRVKLFNRLTHKPWYK